MKLKKEITNFEKNNKLIDKLSNEISTNEKIYKNKLIQIEEINKKTAEIGNKTENLNNYLSDISTKLEIISTEKFNGKTAENYEKEIRKQVEELKNNISEIRNQETRISTQLSENEDLSKELSIKLKSTKTEFEYKNNILSEKLRKIGFETVELATNSLLSDEEAKIIKQKNQELQDSKLSVNQSLKDVSTDYEIETKKDDNEFILEELSTKLNNTEQNKQSDNQEIGSIIATLKNDSEQKEKLSELQTEIKKLKIEYERWEALNKAIGDAKGKRFAEIAHQFTLTELIAISNKHLKNFSARYLLDKTSDSKNFLFVRDAYMGMSKRSVHTLSGGETFLVSLSMALALSDLASRKTKIESLFIDEGFGTLDEQTLDKALNSLEQLHSDYNRTIGLISHVPEIKERINTQILISKSNSGYSTIEINN